MKKNSYDQSIDEAIGMVNAKHLSERNIRANIGRTPTMPPDLREQMPKKKYVSNKRLQNKRKSKLPKSIAFLLAAGILAGGIKAITLGMDYSKDKSLAESQEHVSETFDTQNIYEKTGLTEQENNTIQILNSDLNSLIQKYKEKPESVSQEDINTLLQNCYSIGKDVAFNKIARALTQYYHQNPDTIDTQTSSRYFSYKVGNPKNNEPLYYIAECKINNGIPTYTPVATNKEIQDYVGSQYALLDFINQDDINIDKAIQKAKEATTQINNMVNYNLHFEKGLLNRNLVIDKEKDIEDR